MQCTGYSVVRGTDIAAFDVEVIDVVDDRASGDRAADPRQGVRAGRGRDRRRARVLGLADLLPRRAGHAAQHRRDLGVGRRVRRQGRAGDADRGDPRQPGRRAARRRRARRCRRARRPLVAPLTVTGLSARLGAALQRAAAEARADGARRARRAARLVPGRSSCGPGSAFGVGYASGDLAVERDRHGRLHGRRQRLGLRAPVRRRRRALAAAAGRLRLPRGQQPARARANRPAPTSSRRPGTTSARSRTTRSMPSPGASAALPPTVPVRVHATDLDTGATRTVATNVADETAVDQPTGGSILIVPRAARGHAGGRHRARRLARAPDRPGLLRDHASGRRASRCASATATCPTSPDALGAGNVVAGAASTDLLEALALVDTFKAREIHVTGVDVDVQIARGQRQAFLRRCALPRRGRAGKKVRATLVLRHVRGPARGARSASGCRRPASRQAPPGLHRRRRRLCRRRPLRPVRLRLRVRRHRAATSVPERAPPDQPIDGLARYDGILPAPGRRSRGLRSRGALVPRPGPAYLRPRAGDDPDQAALASADAQVGRRPADRPAAPRRRPA